MGHSGSGSPKLSSESLTEAGGTVSLSTTVNPCAPGLSFVPSFISLPRASLMVGEMLICIDQILQIKHCA